MELQRASSEPRALVVDDPPSLQASKSSCRQDDPRIHVLYLIDGIFAMGGGEGALLKIVRHLPHERFRCSLAVFKPGPLYHLFREVGCPVHLFPLESVFSYKSAKAAWQLRNFMRSQSVDIIHTFFETANLWGALVTKAGGGPLLVSSRRDMGFLRSTQHRIAYRLMRNLFDSVVAVSAPVREACIRDEGVSADKVITLHNGVETNKIGRAEVSDSTRASLGLSDASHVITSVGHVRRLKGFDVMVRAAGRVCREFPRAVFVIVGAFYDKQYIEDLKELARSLGIFDNLRFAGPLTDVSAALSVSDVFCLLSRTEGFSNALVEAMACGVPPVATRVGGAEETIVDGQNGFLVNSEDDVAAGERILFLLRNPEFARRLGSEALKTVQTRFTAEIMGNSLGDHYERLITSRRSSSKPKSRIERSRIIGGTSGTPDIR